MLAAGIGAVAMGFFVILNEAGVFAAPALYGPAGGVTGRTTFATLVWLAAANSPSGGRPRLLQQIERAWADAVCHHILEQL
jgi:hypothetical protein